MAVSVSPGFIKVPVPSSGLAGEGMKVITVDNPTDKRIAFKMKGTRLDLYEVDPPFGFVASKAAVLIKVQPRKFSTPGANKNDHFSVLIIPAPDGVTDIKAVWKPTDPAKAPKDPRRFTVQIKYTAASKEAASSSSGESSEESDIGGASTATDTTGDDTYEDGADDDPGDKDGGSKKGSSRRKSGTAGAYVFLDDERTEPPADLVEVPEFMEWKFRRYD